STHGAFGGERHEVIRAQIAQASAALAMARTLAAQLGSLRRDPAVRDHPRMAEELDRAVETVASMIEHLQRIESPFRRRSQG
ncbi:MAG: hypothetical protein R3185_09100, partial [Candidatus Thermoplasmatota archaeon]|nr:hypothetical protein [Candidatus Thermoplasmatota archaeon]